jgi:hypothetical protein
MFDGQGEHKQMDKLLNINPEEVPHWDRQWHQATGAQPLNSTFGSHGNGVALIEDRSTPTSNGNNNNNGNSNGNDRSSLSRHGSLSSTSSRSYSDDSSTPTSPMSESSPSSSSSTEGQPNRTNGRRSRARDISHTNPSSSSTTASSGGGISHGRDRQPATHSKGGTDGVVHGHSR